MRDPANPRSLACVVNLLRGELSRLPPPHGAELAQALSAPTDWPTLSVLCEPGADGQLQALVELTDSLGQSAAGLADLVGARFFSHAEPTLQMASR